LEECENEGPVVITRNGRPVAVLVAPTDKDDLERMVLAHSPRFRAILAKSRKSFDAGKGIPHDEFWKAVKARTRSKAQSSRSKRSNGDAA
jgi:PHD/YefM family antitoxin component YafN of YafNO toxin-antitoxin module